MMYARPNPPNVFEVSGDSESVSLGNIEDRAPHFILTHAEAVTLAGWLIGTVFLQGDRAREEEWNRLMLRAVEEAARRA